MANTGRSFANLRSAGVVSRDLAAIKDFPIRESLKLQSRRIQMALKVVW